VATLHERQTERMDRSSRSRTRWLVILGAIAAVIVAIVLIGMIGLALDVGLSWTARRLSFRE